MINQMINHRRKGFQNKNNISQIRLDQFHFQTLRKFDQNIQKFTPHSSNWYYAQSEKQQFLNKTIYLLIDYYDAQDLKDQVSANKQVMQIREQYFKNIGYGLSNNFKPKCLNCGAFDSFVLEQNEHQQHCGLCFALFSIISDNEKPSYKEFPKEPSYSSYKRENRFLEALNQAQGKQSIEIPPSVYLKIKKAMLNQHIYNFQNVTKKQIKQILKSEDLSKYQEHICLIHNRLTGKQNDIIPPEIIDKLRFLFKPTQHAFSATCPPERRNFVNYKYLIHKLLELHGETRFQNQFKLLKSTEKLIQQDQMWKAICQYNKWGFLPSM